MDYSLENKYKSLISKMDTHIKKPARKGVEDEAQMLF